MKAQEGRRRTEREGTEGESRRNRTEHRGTRRDREEHDGAGRKRKEQGGARKNNKEQAGWNRKEQGGSGSYQEGTEKGTGRSRSEQ